MDVNPKHDCLQDADKVALRCIVSGPITVLVIRPGSECHSYAGFPMLLLPIYNCFCLYNRLNGRRMIQPQTIFGSFDNIAEAQQAVQLLLALGFTGEHVQLATQNEGETAGSVTNTALKNSSGRFFSALFGDSGERSSRQTHSNNNDCRLSVALVTVRVKSADKANQVAGLLHRAGAENVAINERADLNHRKMAL